MTDSAVLYVRDIAAMLGKTVSATRAGIHKRVDWIPPGMFYVGTKRAWMRADVDEWLAKQSTKGIRS